MEGYIMNNHNNFLEQLTLASHKNTETLIELGFQCGSMSDAEIKEHLKEIFNNITEMQANIKHQLCSK